MSNEANKPDRLPVPTAQNVIDLAQKLSMIELEASGPPEPPWDVNEPKFEDFKRAVRSGAHKIARPYLKRYVEPLRANLSRLLDHTHRPHGGKGLEPAETLLGAVYCHSDENEAKVAPALRRCLSVISDFYRSFTDDEHRAQLDLPLTQFLPPLAAFKHTGRLGPYTYPTEVVSDYIDSNIGVVSMPSSYMDHPILWAILAHETGGHDVMHAAPGLLTELYNAVKWTFSEFARSSERCGAKKNAEVARLMGEVWAYWINEAGADVYAVLNMGPVFTMIGGAWLAALRSPFKIDPLIDLKDQKIERRPLEERKPQLFLGAEAAPGRNIDSHPTDLLRIHLTIGAIAHLSDFAYPQRHAYIQELKKFANIMAEGRTKLRLKGRVPQAPKGFIDVDLEIPLEYAQYTAMEVGRLIATCPLMALKGRSIQDIETWDDPQDQTAHRAALGMINGEYTANMGRPEHLLTGAGLAVLNDSTRYDTISQRLGHALDHTYINDPVWSPPSPFCHFYHGDELTTFSHLGEPLDESPDMH